MRRHRKTSTAKHRLPAAQRGEQESCSPRTIEMVDHTGTAHFRTVDAAADGLPQGRYTAVCSEEILPGALVARMTRWCPLSIPLPTQRGSR